MSKNQHAMAAPIREAAAAKTPEAIEFLCVAMNNPKVKWTDRIAAARGILACGHANAIKLDTEPLAGLTITVQQLVVGSAPIRGVLNSPVAENIWRPEHEQQRLLDERLVLVDEVSS